MYYLLEDWHWYADWEVICRVKRPLGSSDRGGAVGRNMADDYGWDQIHKSWGGDQGFMNYSD
jgi:hypothetical protein